MYNPFTTRVRVFFFSCLQRVGVKKNDDDDNDEIKAHVISIKEIPFWITNARGLDCTAL